MTNDNHDTHLQTISLYMNDQWAEKNNIDILTQTQQNVMACQCMLDMLFLK